MLASARRRLSAGGVVTLLLLGLAGVAAASAQTDRALAFPAGERATDDAFVRADITAISARIDGQVLRVLVHDNEAVEAGQLLVEIDPTDHECRAREAEARVDAAEAAIRSNRAKQAMQRSAISAAGAAADASAASADRAALEAERHDRLVGGGVVSAQEHERATFDVTRARAELRQRRSERDRSASEQDWLGSEHAHLVAERDAARAALDLARTRLGYTRIVAPARGVVGEREVRVGQLVREGSSIIHLVALDEPWVTANFKERQVERLAPGAPVSVTIDTFPGLVIAGKVESLAPASGAQLSLLPPDNATGNFTKIVQRIPVKITLDVPPAMRGKLRPGMSAVVTAH